MANTLQAEFIERFKTFSKDREYIKSLAKAMSLPEEEEWKLFSIMGAEELKHILEIAPPRVFQKQKKFYDESFRLNLHTHTTASDGVANPQDFIDRAAEYADYTALQELKEKNNKEDKNISELPAFTLGITDHDTVEGCIKILEAIVQNPEKYRNLRIVLGVELSTVYRNQEALSVPLPFELIWYALNPFAPEVSNLLDTLAQNRLAAMDSIFKMLNDRYAGFAFDKREMFLLSKIIKKGQSPALAFVLRDYVQDKSGDKVPYQDLRDFVFGLDNDKTQGFIINQEIEDIFSAFNKSGMGFIGMAHPARVDLGRFLKPDFVSKMSVVGKDAGREVLSFILSYLLSQGLVALETNYQSYLGNLADASHALQNNEKFSGADYSSYLWVKNIFDFSKEHNLLAAGGFDNHKLFPY